VSIRNVFDGSDSDATRALYRQLEALGPRGVVAVQLLRAQKANERAKVYRGRRFTSAAYDKKAWAIGQLIEALEAHGVELAIGFGWREDPNPPPGYPWVLYCDLPTGQVSFHMATRGRGPDYPRDWDGQTGQAAPRIITWATEVLDGRG